LFGLLSALFGIGVASDLDVNGQNLVGNFLSASADVILTIAAQNQSLQSAKNTKQKVNANELEDRIEKLEKQLKLMHDVLDKYK
jgi:hypothetical protein